MGCAKLGVLHCGFSHLNLPPGYAKDEPSQVISDVASLTDVNGSLPVLNSKL